MFLIIHMFGVIGRSFLGEVELVSAMSLCLLFCTSIS